MNILESGLHTMNMTEDSDGPEEETTDQPETTDLNKMTEEDMNNITDQMMKELQPSMEKIHQRLGSIENTLGAQGDDADRTEADRAHHPRGDSDHQGQGQG
eukprot:8436797-Heterocapsa_arctica.AAC.1